MNYSLLLFIISLPFFALAMEQEDRKSETQQIEMQELSIEHALRSLHADLREDLKSILINDLDIRDRFEKQSATLYNKHLPKELRERKEEKIMINILIDSARKKRDLEQRVYMLEGNRMGCGVAVTMSLCMNIIFFVFYIRCMLTE